MKADSMVFPAFSQNDSFEPLKAPDNLTFSAAVGDGGSLAVWRGRGGSATTTGVNALSEPQIEPLQHIESLLRATRGAKRCTKFDPAQGC